MPVARPEPSDARVIAHVDMDCFYVQVEQRKQPELRGLPIAVVQYNSWKGGALIAISYEARKFGVKRSMRGDEAKKACPEIQLVQVPVARGKADLNSYRSAGSEVFSILAQKGRCERASIDEVYLDLSDAAEAMLSENPPETLEAIDKEVLKSHILGLDENEKGKEETVREWLRRSNASRQDKLLACGAIIVAELRMQILKETEFTCSSGIAHNKMLAKLASAMNKPAQQTIVPLSSVKGLLATLPIKKMKHLGGKLGCSIQSDLGVNTVGDLLQFSEQKLQDMYGFNTGTWLWNVARGISGDEVEGRLLPKSHGCGKTFRGPETLKTLASVENWLNDLCEELSERIQSDLEQNERVAHTLTLHATVYKTNDSDSHKKFPSKSCPLRYGTAKIQEDAIKLFNTGLREFLDSQRVEIQGTQNSTWRLTSLSISASKILAKPSGTRSILRFFNSHDPSHTSQGQAYSGVDQNSIPSSPSGGENQFAPDQVEAKNETVFNYVTSSPARSEHQRATSNPKGTRSILGLLHSHDPSCSLEGQAYSGIDQNSIPTSPSGKESHLASVQVEAKKETVVNYEKSCPVQREQRGDTSCLKESGSILRFFHSQHPSCSSSSEERHNLVITDATPLPTPGNERGLGSNEVSSHRSSRLEEGRTSNDNSFVHDEQRRETWSFNVDEIDPSVIDELPPEIQHEVRGWLKPLKRAKTVKKGSSIADYFLPSKRT